MGLHTCMQQLSNSKCYDAILIDFGTYFFGLCSQTDWFVSVKPKNDPFFNFFLDQRRDIFQIYGHDDDLIDGGGKITQAHLGEILQLDAQVYRAVVDNAFLKRGARSWDLVFN